MSARAMKGALELLKPYMENDKNTISLGKVVIGTVKGDLHDIGKNLVSSMLEGCGFEVINLGVDVSDEKFVEAAKEHKSNIVCMRSLIHILQRPTRRYLSGFLRKPDTEMLEKPG